MWVTTTPNDPTLSDCGARRAGCGKVAGAGWAQAAGRSAAASVTRGAVRCSAWFGDLVCAFECVSRIVVLRKCDGASNESLGADSIFVAGSYIVEFDAAVYVR